MRKMPNDMWVAVDHPHGGGRGKSKGNVHPVSPWGVPVSQHPAVTTFRLGFTDEIRRPNRVIRHETKGTPINGWL